AGRRRSSPRGTSGSSHARCGLSQVPSCAPYLIFLLSRRRTARGRGTAPRLGFATLRRLLGRRLLGRGLLGRRLLGRRLLGRGLLGCRLLGRGLLGRRLSREQADVGYFEPRQRLAMAPA